MVAALQASTGGGGGGGAATVRLTGIVFGEPSAPGAVTVTVAVYVPASSEAVLKLTARPSSSPSLEPAAGVTESHAASSDT